ncbi:hypothetical protein O0L34_g12057 [Tuta absoluta]|nr:hypothetical protein O0L34_g12057 [Tuta absoluta]
MSKNFDELYEKIKSQGENTVDNLVKFMKEAKILEMAKMTEQSAYNMFKEVEDKKDVPSAKFKEVINEMAGQAKMTTAQMMEAMEKQAATILEALKAAGTAFSAALSGDAGTSKDAKK